MIHIRDSSAITQRQGFLQIHQLGWSLCSFLLQSELMVATNLVRVGANAVCASRETPRAVQHTSSLLVGESLSLWSSSLVFTVPAFVDKGCRHHLAILRALYTGSFSLPQDHTILPPPPRPSCSGQAESVFFLRGGGVAQERFFLTKIKYSFFVGLIGSGSGSIWPSSQRIQDYLIERYWLRSKSCTLTKTKAQ